MSDFFKKLLRLKASGSGIVSSALLIEAGPYSAAIKSAIAAIDSVHKDGILPDILINRGNIKNHGEFYYNPSDMRAVGICVQYATNHPELTVAHEIGHFLDLKGIGIPDNFASEESAFLDGWRDAVTSSAAIAQIGSIYSAPNGRFAETLPGGIVVEYKVNREYADYLLDSKEVWARSYAQYIALKSGNNNMLLQLDKLRDRPYNGIYYLEQWSDTDFQPIMLAIDNTFKKLGWINI